MRTSAAARLGSAPVPVKLQRGLDKDPGVIENVRLTALTGGLLLVLLGLIGLTILDVQALLPQHLLLGFVLIPPLLLKFASTGYRFMRYYAGDLRYRAAGPPALGLRLLAPLVLISTVALFGTGLELWFFGLRFGSIWVGLHKASFVGWAAVTAIHVLAHLGRTINVAAEELRDAPPEPMTRRSLVVGSLVLGLALAGASLAYRSPFLFFGE